MRYRCTHRGSKLSESEKCGARRKLNKPIEQYVRRPHCLACGRDSLTLDRAHYRRKRKLKCVCSGVPFPHERGTILGCEHYDKPFTEEEYRDYINGLQKASRGY